MVTKAHAAFRSATIRNELGLHARSAAMIAGLAGKSKANVWILKADESADASSILDILMLACEKGTDIKIAIEDAADIDILNAIADLVESGFEE